MLSNEGYSVEIAENGKKAIKACEKYPFDVALIDIELPDVKGTELLTKLKEIQPKIVEIIITGHPSMENAIKAVNQKADGYVLKPFEAPVLLETIKRLFAEKENEYFKMLKEVTNGKEKTPPTKFQNPDRW
jgi:DNA-binding NtrC family response regulator